MKRTDTMTAQITNSLYFLSLRIKIANNAGAIFIPAAQPNATYDAYLMTLFSDRYPKMNMKQKAIHSVIELPRVIAKLTGAESRANKNNAST